MTQWFVKDLAQLTGISVQTLHHYDRIGILKPSLRMANGYRVYSEKDLVILQQIIALKFFGFELAQIKSLLAEEDKILDHFNNQVRVLEQKASALSEGAKTLKGIIESVDRHKSIPWETIIELIEVYKMTADIEHSWVKEIFTPEELKQYVAFENQLKANKTSEQLAVFEKQWQQLLAELREAVNSDPESAEGILVGKKYMEWVNSIYGKKYAHLRTKKWEQGFGEGKGLEDVGLTMELVSWLEKATDAYWRARFFGILNLFGSISEAKLLSLWNEALDDLYGEEESRKQAIYEIALADNQVSQQAKDWLKKIASFQI